MSTNGEKFSRGESFSTAALLNKSADHVFDAPGGIAFRLNPDGYGKASTAERDKVASFVNNWIERTKDPASEIPGAPPLFGQDVAPHAMTFASKIGSQAKTYLPSDESLEANQNDALLMRKDLGIMECLEIRQRMTALLDWSIVPEDTKSPAQKSVAAELTKIIKRVRRWTEYRRCLMDAIWIGRSAIQHTYGHANIGGKMYCFPRAKHADATGWKHIHGDKVVFRYDDGEKMANGAFPDQMGIRVSAIIQKDSRIRGIQDIEYTNSGAAIFLSPAERQTVICHKHMIEDAEYNNPRKAGRLHGVGIRDRIYNEWFLKQEILGFLMEYMERSAGGIEIYEYPSGDEAAKRSVMEAAKNRMAFGRNQIFFPKPLGMDSAVYDLRIVEPGFAGMDMLVNIQDKYFGHRIKRYIIGQTLSTEADATGLGSSVADFQKDSLSQIVMYDSNNLEETLTHELVRPIQLANWPETESWQFDLKHELESDNVKEKLDGYKSAWEMGLGIPEKDVAEAIGVSLDNPNEKILKNLTAGGGGAPGMGNGMQFPAGTGFGNQIDAAHEHVKAAGEVKGLKDGVIDHVAGKLGEGEGGETPSSPADQYSRQMSLWDADEHPRNEEGQFVEKSESLPDGKVRMKQAKAGGETSDVDGKFYKGGRLMPVHGLYSGREKPASKPKRENPFGGLPVANEDSKGLPAARKRTDEQIEREQQELKDKAEWLSVQSGPVRDMVWVGDKPGKTAYNVGKQLVPFLSGLTDEQVQQIGEFAFQSVIDDTLEKYPSIDRKEIESEFNGHAAYTADLLLSKKIRKQFPSMERTVEAIRQYSELPDQLQRWIEMDEHLRDVLGAVAADKYSREFNEQDHPRDEAGRFTERVNQLKARILRMRESLLKIPAEQRHPGNIAKLNEAGQELHAMTGERLTKDGWAKEQQKPVARNPQFRHASPEAQKVGNQFVVDHLGIKTAALSQDIAEGDWAHEFEKQNGRRWEPDQYSRDFNEEDHPRNPAGGGTGGQFTSAPESSSSSADEGDENSDEPVARSPQLTSDQIPPIPAPKKMRADRETIWSYGGEIFDLANAGHTPEQIAQQMLAEHSTQFINDDDLSAFHKAAEDHLTDELSDINEDEEITIDGQDWEDWLSDTTTKMAEAAVLPALARDIKTSLEQPIDRDTREEIIDYLDAVKHHPVKRNQFTQKIIERWPVLRADAENIVKRHLGPENYQRRSDRLLHEAASMTNTSPTEAQREAGNYSKGVYSWKGMEIAIENPKGSTRSGCSSSGREWSRKMASHYGYFRRTAAVDGDNLDVFIGRHPESDFVLVIKQVDQDGKFDEFKVVAGCLNRKQAKKLYLANYPAGWKCGPAAGMTVELFKRWIASDGPMKGRSIKAEC